MRRVSHAARFLFCTAALCLSLCAVALANDYVFDEGYLLPEEQSDELERQARNIAERYDFGVYLIIVNNMEEYGYSDPYDCAVAFYEDSNFGFGEDRDGELLFMSMEDRQYATVYYGYGEIAFTEAGRDLLEDAMLSRFHDDDWYGGFWEYYSQSEYLLSAAASGEPVGWDEYGAYHPDDGDYDDDDYYQSRSGGGVTFQGLLFTFGGAALVAGLICMGMASQLTSVRQSTEASRYINAAGLTVRSRSDVFTHTTETRTKIEKNSGSKGGGGGGSHHHSGGGHSGRSGSF